MKQLFFAVFFCSALQLSAAFLDIEAYAGPGYRRDTFTLEFFNNANPSTLEYELDFEKGHSPQAALYFNLIWDRFRWEFSGDYGWLVEAEGSIQTPLTVLGNPDIIFAPKNFYGYEADGSTAFGYDIRLYSFRYFSFELTPLLGVQYRTIATRTKGRLADEFSSTPPSAFLYQETRLAHADLWGPYAEARLNFLFQGMFNLRLFYQFTYLYYRHVIEPTFDLITMPGVPPVTLNIIDTHIVVREDGSFSHLGGFDVQVKTIGNILIGVRGYGIRIYTRDAEARIQSRNIDINNGGDVTQNFVVPADFGWTIYSAVLYFGYRF